MSTNSIANFRSNWKRLKMVQVWTANNALLLTTTEHLLRCEFYAHKAIASVFHPKRPKPRYCERTGWLLFMVQFDFWGIYWKWRLAFSDSIKFFEKKDYFPANIGTHSGSTNWQDFWWQFWYCIPYLWRQKPWQ